MKPLDRGTQWDRTVALFKRSADGPHLLDGYGRIGVIVRPHRLFLVGDAVIYDRNNGNAERYPVWGYSSKGYAVEHLYLRFQAWRRFSCPLRASRRYNAVERRTPVAPQPYDREREKAWLAAHPTQRFQAGPLELLEEPDDLLDLRVDDPAVRRYVVETLRAGGAAGRVGSGSPLPKGET